MDDRTPSAARPATPAAGATTLPETTWDDLPAEVRARLQARIAAQEQGSQAPDTVAEAVPAAAPPAVSAHTRALVLRVDRGVLAVARHWVLAVNIIGGIYAGLPVLGPWLLSKGLTIPASIIYYFYHLTCHQLPQRSFNVFGHKMCYCQRCCAIYTGIFCFGLLYPLFSRRLLPLRWRWMFLLWLPMAIDGFTQLFGLRESNWQLRVITGTLFALSCVWVAFPHLERAFAEMRRDLETRFARQKVLSAE
jgi:uncharacterized membrane protein